MNKNEKLQVLLIQLEFSTWQMARPWTYCANFAVREGLEANGVECHTIPAIPPSSPSLSLDWLQHAEQICNGKRFDQVWVWLVHHEYDQRFLEWLASLAPVRVGYVMESLSYSEDEHQFSPITKQRKAVVDRQIQYLTHMVVCDELDALEFNVMGKAKALWCPAFVPERFIVQPSVPAVNRKAVFHGTPYGHRQSWVEHPALKGNLVSPPSQPTKVQRLFDQLHVVTARALRDRGGDVESLLSQYLSGLQRIRLTEFMQWMDGLAQWACIVNLPGFQKGYGGRVYEAMAVGRPVISWDIPNRPMNRALFEEGKEILLFPPDDPGSLARHISGTLSDCGFAAQLARNAHHKMATHHSAEIRIRQILQWIESGQEPSFGAENADRVSTAKQPDVVSPSSLPAVSIVIPCFNQAHFLSEAVESVISQVYDDWECLIVDDGSPDQTSIVARQLIDRHPNRRIRLICKANGGLADARNAGIREARGRYILPLDADDRLHPEYLAHTVPILDCQTEISIVYVDEHNFGETTHVHRKGVSNLANLLRGNVHDYCTLYRRSVWEVVGGYSPAMLIGAEDWNFWIDAAKRGFRSYHVEKPLFLYRNRSGTMVEQVKTNMEVVEAHLIMHHPDLFTEAGRAQAEAILSRLSEENRKKLSSVCAAHPDNELLKTFHRLAHGHGAMPVAVPGAEVDRTMPLPSVVPVTTVAARHGDGHDHDDAYYADLFIKNPEWSAPEPNDDETARWVKIASFLEHIVRANRKTGRTKRLRILDLGCGRGWLTNLASSYGDCTGVEPVAAVVAHARMLFPRLRFHAGTADTLLSEPDFEPFDIVLTSEVIEHVPRPYQPEFVQLIRKLVKPTGYVVVTTPRGEVFDLWKKIAPPNQPTEDWLTEEDLRRLFESHQFVRLGNEQAWIELPSFRFLPAPTPADHVARKLTPFYQIWAWQAPSEKGIPVTTLPFMSAPTVSVIVPTYNRPDRLREALASIEAQTYRDFEVVVVNDGEIEVAPVVAEVNRDGHITYIRQDRNRGLAAARNTGLRVAKGKYVAYLDDDDRYLPNHLETLVKFLEGSEFKVAYTDAWRVHETSEMGQYIEIGRDLPYSFDFNPTGLLVSNYFPVLCVMHERACIQEVGGFDESLYAHEDWDLWVRMATKYPFKHLKRITAEFSWRTDGSSMTSATQETYWRTTEIIYRKYRPYAERISGVLDAQQRRLEELRCTRSSRDYICSIVIPVCNRVELTRECFTALAGLKGLPEYELIVVDNGSTDGTAEFLSQLGGDVRIITNPENAGFAKACNQGAAVARGKYLVFLNNDTVPQPCWLNALVDEAEDNASVGVVGSKLLYPDGKIQHAGVVRDCLNFLPYHIYKSFPGDHPAVNQRREFQIVTAACLLIRRSLFEEVGRFDEGYVNGFEDADLCLKVRERGYLVVYQPRSVVVHLEHQTPGRKAHEEANAARFLERWGAQWWTADEYRQFYVDGYKLRHIFRHGVLGGDIESLGDIKDRASWSHVAAAQTAALKKDWQAVRRELALANGWPSDTYVLSWGAMVAKRLQEPVFHVNFLSRYLELENDPALRVRVIRELLEQQDLGAADRHIQKLLSVSPNHAEGLLLKGILSMQREQYEQAETAFDWAMREGADRKKCLMGMGMAAMGRSYTQGAWERFVHVLAEYPDDAEAVHWLLRAGTAQNRWRELSRQLCSYVERNPGDVATRFAFASVLLRGEQIEAARREYDALRQIAPSYDGLDELGRAITGREAALALDTASS